MSNWPVIILSNFKEFITNQYSQVGQAEVTTKIIQVPKVKSQEISNESSGNFLATKLNSPFYFNFYTISYSCFPPFPADVRTQNPRPRRVCLQQRRGHLRTRVRRRCIDASLLRRLHLWRHGSDSMPRARENRL